MREGAIRLDIFEAIEARRSVRAFTADRPVSDEAVQRLLASACLAPSAGNVQPWRFYVVRREELKAGLAAAALGQSFLSQAPLVIVVCADLDAHAQAYGKRGVELYAVQDCAAATQNILLAATALGLAACWVGAFREREAAAALNLAGNIRPLAMVPVGYAAASGSQPRKMGYERVSTYL
jgi:nitroreductase